MFYHDLKPERELVFQRRVDSDVEHELHTHDMLEINVLLNNRAAFQLVDRRCDGEPGDVFWFRPYEPHYNLTHDAAKPIEWIMVLFSPSIVRLIPFGYRLLYPFYTGAVHPHISGDHAYARQIHAAARSAYEEQVQRRPAWESRQFMHFIDILSSIYRYATDQLAQEGNVEADMGVIAAVEHILRHIGEEIDAAELIRLHGRGKTQFYAQFRKMVGVTPNHFIHRLRMQMAMYLLHATASKITDIAYECGYNSIHYFNKHFKEYQGVSPREYRKRRQSGGAAG